MDRLSLMRTDCAHPIPIPGIEWPTFCMWNSRWEWAFRTPRHPMIIIIIIIQPILPITPPEMKRPPPTTIESFEPFCSAFPNDSPMISILPANPMEDTTFRNVRLCSCVSCVHVGTYKTRFKLVSNDLHSLSCSTLTTLVSFLSCWCGIGRHNDPVSRHWL